MCGSKPPYSNSEHTLYLFTARFPWVHTYSLCLNLFSLEATKKMCSPITSSFLIQINLICKCAKNRTDTSQKKRYKSSLNLWKRIQQPHPLGKTSKNYIKTLSYPSQNADHWENMWQQMLLRTQKKTHTHTYWNFIVMEKRRMKLCRFFKKMKANEYINILNKIRQSWNN